MTGMQSRFHLPALSASDIPWLALNTIELLSAIFILGLVGAKYDATSDDHSSATYTIIISVATLFTVPLLAYLALSPPSSRLWVLLVLVWQFVVAVLWAAASGTMGKQTLDGREPEALKASFGFALVEMICFLVGCVMGSVGICCGGKKPAKQNGEDWKP